MGSKKTKFLVAGLIVIAAIASLAFFAARDHMVYYHTVAEITERGPSENVRVSGELVQGTVERGEISDSLRFDIHDTEDDSVMIPVEYAGPVPDTFKDQPDVEVVVDGDYLQDGVFVADNLLAKCPSKYESESQSENQSENRAEGEGE